jgi:hypothetical protein
VQHTMKDARGTLGVAACLSFCPQPLKEPGAPPASILTLTSSLTARSKGAGTPIPPGKSQGLLPLSLSMSGMGRPAGPPTSKAYLDFWKGLGGHSGSCLVPPGQGWAEPLDLTEVDEEGTLGTIHPEEGIAGVRGPAGTHPLWRGPGLGMEPAPPPRFPLHAIPGDLEVPRASLNVMPCPKHPARKGKEEKLNQEASPRTLCPGL